MKKILTYIGFTFAAVILSVFSTSVVYANSCYSDLQFCNDKQICVQATRGIGKADLANKTRLEPNRVWSSSSLYIHFVKAAKKRGLGCGVASTALANTNKCVISTPQFCSTREVCELATFKQLGTKSWKIGKYTVYVDEAKKRDLTCGVNETKKATCKDNPKICNNGVVCNWATKKEGLKWIWNNSSRSKVYVQEAKRRGLSCGVQDTKKATCKNDPKVCGNGSVCTYATKTVGLKRMWDNSSKSKVYVQEAKKRGHTCGVINALETKTCKLPAQGACSSQKLLCELAVSSGKWRTGDLFQPYVQEAKRRGLTCRVQDTKTVLANSCKTDESFCSDDELCRVALKNHSQWNSYRPQYVWAAKQRGLTCGIKEKQNPLRVPDDELCSRATQIVDNKIVWKTKFMYQDYASVAKGRGLTCDVNNTAKTTNNNPKPQLLGSWQGSINCQGTIYTFDAKLSKSNGSNQLYLKTANYVYQGSFFENVRDKNVRFKANRSDGEVFDEVFQISSNHSKISGTTSRKCYLTSQRQPRIKLEFNNLKKNQRKTVQIRLRDYGLYRSTIDGMFGPSTNTALQNFNRQYFGNKNLENYPNSSNILNTLLKRNDANLGSGKSVIGSLKQTVKTTESFSKPDFNRLSVTQRKQLQYGLKKLGYYTSLIDGLYGPNTERAVRAYARAKGLNGGYPNSIYRKLTTEVSVPSSFAVAKRQNNNPIRNSNSDCRSILSDLTGIDALCSKNTGSRKIFKVPEYGSNSSGTTTATPSNSCYSNAQCGSRAVCIKTAGRGGECVNLRTGTTRRNFSTTSCVTDFDCGVGNKCHRSHKICIER